MNIINTVFRTPSVTLKSFEKLTGVNCERGDLLNGEETERGKKHLMSKWFIIFVSWGSKEKGKDKIMMIIPSEKSHPWDDDDHLHFHELDHLASSDRKFTGKGKSEGRGIKLDDDDHRSFLWNENTREREGGEKGKRRCGTRERERKHQMSQIIDFQFLFFPKSHVFAFTRKEKKERK